MSRDKTSEMLRLAVERGLSGLHTCLPATVESYNHAKRKASVKPSIKKKYRDGRTDDMPVIDSVPVVFPSGGGFSMTYPLSEGDNVLLLFSERSLEGWLDGGDSPEDPRQFDLTDAIAIPGVNPFQNSGGSGDVLSAIIGESGISSVAASDLRSKIAASLPGITTGVATLREAVQLIEGGILNVPAAVDLFDTGVAQLEDADTALTQAFPVLAQLSRSAVGLSQFYSGSVFNLGELGRELRFSTEDLDGLASAIDLVADLGTAAATASTLIDGIDTVAGMLGTSLSVLDGVGTFASLIPGLGNQATNVEIHYNGFRLVVNQDGRYTIGNQQDDFMEIMQMLFSALSVATCIPGSPLSEAPLFLALFHRILNMRGNLSTILPLVQTFAPDIGQILGGEPSEVIITGGGEAEGEA